MKTSELTGDALLWAVATCQGYTDLHTINGRAPHEPRLAMMPPRREYGAMELWEIGSDSDWEFFGPIIEREKITIEWTGEDWMGYIWHDREFFGHTPLIAAMRCYVESKLGDEIEIPEALKCEA